MRQIVLDTETTGLEPDLGHRIIEIGAVEVINRKLTGRHFHKYVNPEREVDDGAFEVHGLDAQFLSDKPLFGEVCDELLEFIEGAELVIHNAPFDVSFIDYELSLLKKAGRKIIPRLKSLCTITDSLAVARQKHPGQKNNLDALCRRYEVDNSQRQLHGALLDAEILADVYLLMTGGQTSLFGKSEDNLAGSAHTELTSEQAAAIANVKVLIVEASSKESEAHERYLDFLEEAGTPPVWRRLAT
jgi:DNA polymerase-3 subunit epsilon